MIFIFYLLIFNSHCGLFTKKFGLIFKGSAASAPTHSQRHLHARLPASGGAFGLVYVSRARFYFCSAKVYFLASINQYFCSFRSTALRPLFSTNSLIFVTLISVFSWISDKISSLLKKCLR